MMSITRTFDLLERYRQNFVKDDALVAKEQGKWVQYSSELYIRNSYFIAYGLLALGIQKGDKIITVTNNRPEWNFMDMGIALIGGVHVTVFTSLAEKEYRYILDHSDAKLVVISDSSTYARVKPACDHTPGKLDLYTFDEVVGAKSWKEILSLGEKNETRFTDEVQALKDSIREDDFATLIYTSGTTGTFKGVMLSHRNLVRNFLAAASIFHLGPEDKYLSVLPICHVGGRMGNYQTQYSGSSIYYTENMAAIASNMKEVKPDGFDTVPRILEKVFDNVIARGKTLSGMKRRIFFWAVKIGLKYKLPEDSSWFYRFRLKLADKLIFKKWREALGGNVRLAGCGGASLQPRLERIFWAAGIRVLNMYGLTETSPVITINRQEKPDLKLGTVGAPIEGVEVRIAEDGEVLCRGHNVMLGYYKDPELTASAIDKDGWFHSGDIGKMEEGRYLRITDRKKEIFKLSNGKFVAPQVIENIFKESLFIEQIMVVGEHQKFAGALISPNFAYIRDWCKSAGLAAGSDAELIRDTEVIKAVSSDVEELNKRLNDPEKIRRFKLVADDWSPGSGELSPTLKLRRSFISQKYKSILKEIFPEQTV